MIEITQEYFASIAKNINKSDYNFQSNYCDNSMSVEEHNYNIKDIVDEQGYIVLDFPSYGPKVEAYLEDMFGSYMIDKNPDKLNYTKLHYSPSSKYYALSSLAQPIHTDEGYTNIYPKYIALYCLNESSIGGCSILVKFKPLFEIITNYYASIIEQLFQKDALIVHNANGCATKPLLFKFNNNSIGISYSPVLKKLECDEKTADVFRFITSYVHDVKNQIRFKLKKNQILILDNRVMLHGRTSFLNNTERLMHRYWLGQESLC